MKRVVFVFMVLYSCNIVAGGPFGGWAADGADCRYVNTEVGVSRNVTAGVITPANVFFYGGECRITGSRSQANKYAFAGICDEGDGPYEYELLVEVRDSNTIRAKWPDIGWTTFRRCWNLPRNWRALSAGHY